MVRVLSRKMMASTESQERRWAEFLPSCSSMPLATSEGSSTTDGQAEMPVSVLVAGPK